MSTDTREDQRYVRNKKTSIDHSYINSGEYRRKFDNISDDKKLNRLVYQVAKQMLNHRAGSMYEDMYWIDIDTLKIIAKETTQKEESKIIYSADTKKAIKRYNNILSIHTHPSSMPPSIDDFNSSYNNKYSISLVCCHDGKLYMYKSYKYFFKFFHNGTIRKYITKGYDEFDAQIFALNELQESGCISYKEVL